MGVEFLELDLGFHHHIYQFISVIVPFLDTTEITGSALIIDDKRHDIMAKAFLKQNESTNTAISILEGEDLLEPDMEI